MLGPFGTRRGMLLYLLVWLMLGLVLAGLVAGVSGAAWPNALAFALPLTVLYAIAAGFSAMYLCRAYPLSGQFRPHVLLVFATTAGIAAAAWTGGALFWETVLASGGYGVTVGPALRSMLFGLAVVLYGLCVLGHYLVIEFDRTRAAERRELESKLLAQDAELRLLRTQVDPHFLFNSLNSISALTSIDAARARQMTVQLSDFFRRTLGLDAQRKVAVREEARLAADFLAIEQVRFGTRLRSEMTIADDAAICLLPPLILQPLVENAVKHGIGGLPDGGTIRVQARRDGTRLRVAVENDVDADAPARKGNSMGLANVRQRLANVYAHDAAVSWARENNTFRVELNLPAETIDTAETGD